MSRALWRVRSRGELLLAFTAPSLLLCVLVHSRQGIAQQRAWALPGQPREGVSAIKFKLSLEQALVYFLAGDFLPSFLRTWQCFLLAAARGNV